MGTYGTQCICPLTFQTICQKVSQEMKRLSHMLVINKPYRCNLSYIFKNTMIAYNEVQKNIIYKHILIITNNKREKLDLGLGSLKKSISYISQKQIKLNESQGLEAFLFANLFFRLTYTFHSRDFTLKYSKIKSLSHFFEMLMTSNDMKNCTYIRV